MAKTLEQIQEELTKPLKGSDIELRASRVVGSSAILLAYKDARVDVRRLNSIMGIFGWTRRHEIIDGKNYCTVGLKDPETGEWVFKQDIGTESKTEANKGEASDAFKRACFQWGIGLELYDMPVITVPVSPTKSYRGYKINIAYFANEKDRTKLAVMTIKDVNDVTVFTYTHPDYISKKRATELGCNATEIYVP